MNGLVVEVRRHGLRVGRGDSLSPYGVAVATALARCSPGFDVVVASRALRACETAELIGGTLDHVEDDLDPADEKLSRGALARFEQFTEPQDLAVGRRALAGVERHCPETGRMLVVTHAGIVQAIAAAVEVGAVDGPAPGHCEGILLERTPTWRVTGILRVDEEALVENSSDRRGL